MHYTQQSDADLISAYVAGNERALEVLIKRYKDKVYTSIYMIVKDKYIAEDLFQEAFLKMIRTIKEGRYSEQGKFLPWAIRVAHNLCMDHFRRVRVQVPVTTPDGRELIPALHDVENPSEKIERRQNHETVRQLIAELPEDQREVIVLRIYAELSFKEIADLTGVSINTALGRMRYALLNLRKKISVDQLVLR